MGSICSDFTRFYIPHKYFLYELLADIFLGGDDAQSKKPNAMSPGIIALIVIIVALVVSVVVGAGVWRLVKAKKNAGAS